VTRHTLIKIHRFYTAAPKDETDADVVVADAPKVISASDVKVRCIFSSLDAVLVVRANGFAESEFSVDFGARAHCLFSHF
jgi:hypothetical protein